MKSSTLTNAHTPNPDFDICFKHDLICPTANSKDGFAGRLYDSGEKREKEIGRNSG